MKLVILDRDGVINEDSDDFIKTLDEFIEYFRSEVLVNIPTDILADKRPNSWGKILI